MSHQDIIMNRSLLNNTFEFFAWPKFQDVHGLGIEQMLNLPVSRNVMKHADFRFLDLEIVLGWSWHLL